MRALLHERGAVIFWQVVHLAEEGAEAMACDALARDAQLHVQAPRVLLHQRADLRIVCECARQAAAVEQLQDGSLDPACHVEHDEALLADMAGICQQSPQSLHGLEQGQGSQPGPLHALSLQPLALRQGRVWSLVVDLAR